VVFSPWADGKMFSKDLRDKTVIATDLKPKRPPVGIPGFAVCQLYGHSAGKATPIEYGRATEPPGGLQRIDNAPRRHK